jgi:hypothetical protein
VISGARNPYDIGAPVQSIGRFGIIRRGLDPVLPDQRQQRIDAPRSRPSSVIRGVDRVDRPSIHRGGREQAVQSGNDIIGAASWSSGSRIISNFAMRGMVQKCAVRRTMGSVHGHDAALAKGG